MLVINYDNLNNNNDRKLYNGYQPIQEGVTSDRSQIQSPRNRGEGERLELGQLIGKPVQTFVEPVTLDCTGRLDVPLK